MADRDVALPNEAEVTPDREALHDPTPVKPLPSPPGSSCS
jgi:hypothetical protein